MQLMMCVWLLFVLFSLQGGVLFCSCEVVHIFCGKIRGVSVLEPEYTSTRETDVWIHHRLTFQAKSECIKFVIHMFVLLCSLLVIE